jgi:hypothetical protein
MTGHLDRRQEGHQTPGPPTVPEARDALGAAAGGVRGGR